MARSELKFFIVSSIGKKYLMALTGLVLCVFVLGHMIGNLLIFLGPRAYNFYGHLITSGYFIYFVELVLAVVFLIHVIIGILLTIQNWKAKPVNTALLPNEDKKATLASQTMIIHGGFLLLFVFNHVLTLKFGTYYEVVYDGVVMRDLYRLMLDVFSQPTYLIWYVICMIALYFHLSHGFSSAFQSLGIYSKKLRAIVVPLGVIYAVLVSGGFIAQPLYIFLITR